MTLSSTTVKTVYQGDGATRDFSTVFTFWNSSEIEVTLVSSSDNETIWTEGTEYTVTGGDGLAGTVTATSSGAQDFVPATGEDLVVKSNVLDIQETSLPAGGAFPSTSVEQEFDRTVRRIQQKEEIFERIPTLSVGSTFASSSGISLDDPVDNQVLAWSSSDNTVVKNIAVADISTSIDTNLANLTASDRLQYDGNNWVNYVPETINVKDSQYGAVGDGVTNDTAAIQSAIDAATDGETVFFPPGTYLVNASLTPRTGVSFFSYGATIKLADAANTRIIDGDGVSRVSIEGLIFDGNRANNTDADDDVRTSVYLVDSSNVTQITRIRIHNCEFISSSGGAVTLGAATYSSVTNCYMENLRTSGISTIGGTIQNSEWCVFSNNRIRQCGNSGVIPMGTARHCSIVGNVIENTGISNGSDAITCYSENNFGNVISGNVITNSGNHGIHVGGDYQIVSGNSIEDSSQVATGANGILVESQAAESANHIAIVGNTIHETGANVGAGISVQDRADQTSVTGNVVHNTINIGIEIDDSGNCTVSGNHVFASGAEGILVNNTTRFTLSGNMVGDSNQDGISLTGTTAQGVVNGNTVEDSGRSVGAGTGFAFKVASGVNRIQITGNHFRETPEASLVSLPATPTQVIFGDNLYTDSTAHEAEVSVASATTIELSPHVSDFLITGTTNITTIDGGWEGRVVTLRFSGILTVNDSTGNINLGTNYTTVATGTLMLKSDGTDWFELSRSAN